MSLNRPHLLHQILRRETKKLQQQTGRVRAAHLIRPPVRGIKEVILKIRQMPKNIQQAVVIWIVGEAITYTTLFVKWLPSSFTSQKIDLFLCQSYHNPMHFKWWLYYLTEELCKWLIWLGIVKSIVDYSDFLFLVSIIFLGCRTIDIGMYLWNFKEYDLMYIDLFYIMLTLIWSVFKGQDSKQVAKIKSLF